MVVVVVGRFALEKGMANGVSRDGAIGWPCVHADGGGGGGRGP